MEQSIYRISLDIHSVASQLSFGVNRGDNMRRLIITLTENGKPYRITTDCHAAFTTVKSDGNSIINYCTCNFENNTITYDFTEQTTAVAGKLDCSVILYNSSNERITSPRFTVIVYETNHQNIDLQSTSEYTELITHLSYFNSVIETHEKNVAMGVYNGKDGKDGEKGASIYSVADGYIILDNPSVGQTTSFDWEDHMTTGSALMGDSVVDGLGNLYIALTEGASPTIQFTGVNIKGKKGDGIPDGGTAGQFLVKTETGTAWEDAPSGGGSSSKSFGTLNTVGMSWQSSSGDSVYLIPKGYDIYNFAHPSYGYVTLTKEQLESGTGNHSFSYTSYYYIKILSTTPYYDEANIASNFYGVTGYTDYMGENSDTTFGTLFLTAE